MDQKDSKYLVARLETGPVTPCHKEFTYEYLGI